MQYALTVTFPGKCITPRKNTTKKSTQSSIRFFVITCVVFLLCMLYISAFNYCYVPYIYILCVYNFFVGYMYQVMHSVFNYVFCFFLFTGLYLYIAIRERLHHTYAYTFLDWEACSSCVITPPGVYTTKLYTIINHVLLCVVL